MFISIAACLVKTCSMNQHVSSKPDKITKTIINVKSSVVRFLMLKNLFKNHDAVTFSHLHHALHNHKQTWVSVSHKNVSQLSKVFLCCCSTPPYTTVRDSLVQHLSWCWAKCHFNCNLSKAFLEIFHLAANLMLLKVFWFLVYSCFSSSLLPWQPFYFRVFVKKGEAPGQLKQV